MTRETSNWGGGLARNGTRARLALRVGDEVQVGHLRTDGAYGFRQDAPWHLRSTGRRMDALLFLQTRDYHRASHARGAPWLPPPPPQRRSAPRPPGSRAVWWLGRGRRGPARGSMLLCRPEDTPMGSSSKPPTPENLARIFVLFVTQKFVLFCSRNCCESKNCLVSLS